jgi:hypothetical protein
MKSPLPFAISVLASWVVFLALPQTAIADTRSVAISPGGGRQFDGWGVSLAFDAYRVDHQSPAAKQKYLDALFSENGLGFNKMRFIVGAGQNPSLVSAGLPKCGCWIEGWESATGQWNDQADQPQRWMLHQAIQRVQARGLRPILEAISLGPPYWMTINGSSAGPSAPMQPNLTDSGLQSFAAYQVQVLTRLSKDDGVVFDTFSPMNEPNSRAWLANGAQDGLYLNHRQQAELIDDVWSRLKSSGLPTQVSATEEMRIGDFRPNQGQLAALGTFQDMLAQPGGPATVAKLGQINVHDYWGDGRADMRALAERLGKPVAMSEGGCCGGWSGTYASSFNMVGALTLADTIRQDIGVLGVRTWSLWQATWGVMKIGDNGELQKFPQYYVLSMLTHALPAGSRLLNTGDQNCLAALQVERGQRRLGIVLFNTQSRDDSDHDYRINLSAFPNMRVVSASQLGASSAAPATMTQSNQVAANLQGGVLSVDAPAHSVTSVILEAQ